MVCVGKWYLGALYRTSKNNLQEIAFKIVVKPFQVTLNMPQILNFKGFFLQNMIIWKHTIYIILKRHA